MKGIGKRASLIGASAIVAVFLIGGLAAAVATGLAPSPFGDVSRSPTDAGPGHECERLHVHVRPMMSSMAIGDTKGFKASVWCGHSDVTNASSISWSLNGSVGSISPSSGPLTTLTATAAGRARVVADATYNNTTGQSHAHVYVYDPNQPHCHWLAVRVSPRWTVTQVGNTTTLGARVYCGWKDVTANATVSWNESGGAGTIAPTGGPSTTFTAVQPGASFVRATASYAGRNATGGGVVVVSDGTSVCLRLFVAVMPRYDDMSVNETQQFDARAFCGRVEVTANATFSWSAAGGIGTVSPTTGPSTTFTAAAPGWGHVVANAAYYAFAGTGWAHVRVR